MFRKILDYPFQSAGTPFDVSGYDNHGHPMGIAFGSHGAESGSGFFAFNGVDSRVHVPFNKSWRDLVALRVEALVRVDSLGKRHNIVEGSLSFALFVGSDGIVRGTYLGKKTDSRPFAQGDTLGASVVGGGGSPDPSPAEAIPEPPTGGQDLGWIGINSSAEFAPDGVERKIVPGTWTRILFVHNGVSLQLFLDDELAGYRDDISSPVLGVQPGGVHVGAWPPSDTYVLDGAIDLIRVWKFDPHYRQRRFFCRSMTPEAKACWNTIFARLVRNRNDPELGPKVDKVFACIQKAEDAMVRAVQSQGREVIEQSRTYGRRYDELWCRGDIDGPGMKSFLQEWLGWLDDVAGNALATYLADVLGCYKELLAIAPEEIGRLPACDPGFGTFLDSVRDASPRIPPEEGAPYGLSSSDDPYDHRRNHDEKGSAGDAT